MLVFLFCLARAEQCHETNADGMQHYVESGNWDCATKLVAEAHAGSVSGKESVFYAARSTAGKVKKHADNLLLYLDKKFALPTPVTCAYKMQQNETHFMVVSRFVKIWDGQSAKWSTYSTKGGQGQVVHTKNLPFDLLRINSTHVEMSVVGEILSRRYYYSFRHKLFDYVLPELSAVNVAFREATGSMQMSSGATLPELHWVLRKRVARWWPRFGADDANDAWDEDSEHFMMDLVRQSPLTCELHYCPSDDTCVENCADCPQRSVAAADHVCHLAAVPTITDIFFWDANGKIGTVFGKLTWRADPYDIQAVKIKLNVDGTEVTVMGSEYTIASSKATEVLLTSVDYKGVAATPVVYSLVDSIAATGSVTANFTDRDLREGMIAGNIVIQFSSSGHFSDVEFYEQDNMKRRKVLLPLLHGDVRPGMSC